MGYDSLSAVVVLVIVVIIMAGWLPVRTARGMRKVAEHREDKYSPSLHLVGMDDGTRFSDTHTPQAKGIIMQADRTRDAKYTPERIARVRALRHAAIRRRRIIVVALLACTVVVLALSFPLHVSPLFALIPAALTALVLALGARAAAQAREWERRVASSTRRIRAAERARRQAAASHSSIDATPVPVHSAANDADADPSTDVMEQREIRRVLRQAREEQMRALALREAQKAEESARVAAAAAALAQSVQSSAQYVPSGSMPAAAPADMDVQSVPYAPSSDAQPVVAPAMAAASQPVDATSAAAAAMPAAPIPAVVEASDATDELESVTKARALDAFDLAASQDLISFSLGEARNGVDMPAHDPESREIRSQRQVAKAVPADPADVADAAVRAAADVVDAAIDAAVADGSADPALAAASADAAVANAADGVDGSSSDDAGFVAMPDTEAAARRVSEIAAFHDAEESRDVDAPDATEESLGVGLESILARRSA
ncbi:hypothetical protein [Bifidobacterium samirii]|nr:hypothetical protein [Bifidobacterium samirii]